MNKTSISIATGLGSRVRSAVDVNRKKTLMRASFVPFVSGSLRACLPALRLWQTHGS